MIYYAAKEALSYLIFNKLTRSSSINESSGLTVVKH